jgi:ankyrin repeat protein
MSYGRDLKKVYTMDIKSDLLCISISSGNTKIVKRMLKKGVNTDGYYDGYDGVTPLTHAIIYRDIKIVALLLRFGADYHIAELNSGHTPLSRAHLYNLTDIVRLLTIVDFIVPFFSKKYRAISKDIVRESLYY